MSSTHGPFHSLDDVTREWIQSKLSVIEEIAKKDLLTIYGYIIPGVDIKVRTAIEGLENKKILC